MRLNGVGVLVVSILCASATGIGYYLGKSARSNAYTTLKTIELADRHGAILGNLPAGTVLVSELKLSRDGDLGWWAYVPLYFGTTDEARPLVSETKIGSRHVVSEGNTINAREKISSASNSQ